MAKCRCCAPGEPSFPMRTTVGYPQQNGDRVQLPYSLHALPWICGEECRMSLGLSFGTYYKGQG